MSRSAVFAVVLLLILGCRESAAPPSGQAECQVSLDTLSFGYVMTPSFGWVKDYRSLQFTVTNTGDTVLAGRVTIRSKPAGPRDAKFHLSPPDTDPEFLLPPGDSVTFTLGVTMENASHGKYSGEVDLGIECGVIPISLDAIPSQ